MSALQKFSGAVMFDSAEDMRGALAEVADPLVRRELADGVVGQRVVAIDMHRHQPASLWDAWTTALSAIAERATDGCFVAVYEGDGTQLEAFGTPSSSAHRVSTPVAEAPQLALQGLPNLWRFVSDEGGELQLQSRTEDGRLDVLEWGELPFMQVQGLAANGSSIETNVDGATFTWLDTAAEPGEAWLVDRSAYETVSVQQIVGHADVTVPAGTFPRCIHLRLRSFYLPTWVGSADEVQPSTSADVWWARAHGIVKMEVFGSVWSRVGEAERRNTEAAADR